MCHESRSTFLYRRMYVRVHPKMIFGAFFFFFWKRLTYLLSRTETTAQRYLWLNRHAVVKGIQIVSPLFICILKACESSVTSLWVVRRVWVISKNLTLTRDIKIVWYFECRDASLRRLHNTYYFIRLDSILFLAIEVKTNVRIKNLLCFFKSPFI